MTKKNRRLKKSFNGEILKTTGSLPSSRCSEHFFFDRRDYELIRIVNDVCARDQDFLYSRRQYYSYFHPHGIKEMAEVRSLRIAYAFLSES